MLKVSHKTDPNHEVKYKLEQYYFECFENNIIIECDQDNITFDIRNNVEIRCRNYCKILGVDNVEIHCGNCCYIECQDNCRISGGAHGNIIKCFNNAFIYCMDRNNITVGMNSQVICYDECIIDASIGSKIYCLEDCYVEVTQECSIFTKENCYIKADCGNSITTTNSILKINQGNLLSCVNCHIKTNEGMLFCDSFGLFYDNKLNDHNIIISEIKINDDVPLEIELTTYIGYGKFTLYYCIEDLTNETEDFIESFKQGNITKMLIDPNLAKQFQRDVFKHMTYKGI